MGCIHNICYIYIGSIFQLFDSFLLLDTMLYSMSVHYIPWFNHVQFSIFHLHPMIFPWSSHIKILGARCCLISPTSLALATLRRELGQALECLEALWGLASPHWMENTEVSCHKLTGCYGKSPVFKGKPTINGNLQEPILHYQTWPKNKTMWLCFSENRSEQPWI